jgi:virginiamycin B lyase
MAIHRKIFAGLLATASLLAISASPGASAANLPGLADLVGKVSAPKGLGQLTVHAFNTDKSVEYMVYVIDGAYRAVDLIPGHYEITVRGAVGQLNQDLPVPAPTKMEVAAGAHMKADFTLAADTKVPETYFGGMPYPNAKIEPYDVVYPKGPGRDILERTCFGCHTAQLYPYNVVRTYPGGRPAHDHDGWDITIQRMAHGVAFYTAGKASNFDGDKLLPPADQKILVDYLAKYFGPDSAPRAVKQEDQPVLDKAALAKAEIIAYRFLNKPGENRFTHTLDFDPNTGHVFAMDRGAPAIVEVNPATGDRIDHKALFGGEYLQVDVDGTVWYGGLLHLDPKTELTDDYRFAPNKTIGVSTMAIDRNGDMWLSELGAGAIAKYDRKADSIVWWDVPFLRSRPYGLTLDHDDKVWFAEYHNSGIASFDPKTQQFRNYQVTTSEPTNIRRLDVDKNGYMWTATWGHAGLGTASIKEGGSAWRIDPKTGKSEGHLMGISYSNPYDADIDENNNVWIATDNHLVMYNQKTATMTRYPLITRSDVPKLSITRDGAIWFSPRNGGQSGGYGGAAAVLYPDKDHIPTLLAWYSADSERNHRASYKGPTVKVTGVKKLSPPEMQNPGAYQAMLASQGLKASDVQDSAATRVMKSGAAVE